LQFLAIVSCKACIIVLGKPLLNTNPCLSLAKHLQETFRLGRKCLEEYESLLSNVKERRTELANAEEQDVANKRARLSAIPEDGAVFHRMAQGHLTGLPNAAAAIEEEQDLSGFVDVLDDERNKAIETELYLRRLANFLGDMAGGEDHRPVLPEWSLAKNRIPSYYS
jgi:hypothetical protein